MNTDLRGKCREYAEEAVAADPTLTLVRGWYCDPIWGREEHWWAKRADRTIVDPTSAQFPMGGVAEWYEEFEGVYPCWECGAEVAEVDLIQGQCCSHRCFMRMVGLS
jgi:DNA-directed RNA polymerase subunit RPC12/RpoP